LYIFVKEIIKENEGQNQYHNKDDKIKIELMKNNSNSKKENNSTDKFFKKDYDKCNDSSNKEKIITFWE